MKCKGCAFLRYYMNEYGDCGFHYCTRYKDRDGLVFGTASEARKYACHGRGFTKSQVGKSK